MTNRTSLTSRVFFLLSSRLGNRSWRLAPGFFIAYSRFRAERFHQDSTLPGVMERNLGTVGFLKQKSNLKKVPSEAPKRTPVVAERCSVVVCPPKDMFGFAQRELISESTVEFNFRLSAPLEIISASHITTTGASSFQNFYQSHWATGQV